MKKLLKVRNAVRILGLAAFTVVALSFGSGLAKANISIDGGNGLTGPNSENSNDWEIES